VTAEVQRGRQQLGITTERDALLYVPASYAPDRPMPLVLSLHGAGGDAEGGLGLLQSFAEIVCCRLIAVADESCRNCALPATMCSITSLLGST
jgi:hypothetical protein